MARENIFKLYLKTLSVMATLILLASFYFIFTSNYYSGGWMLFGVAAIAVIIRKLEMEYYEEFGYSLWDEKTKRLVNLRPMNNGRIK